MIIESDDARVLKENEINRFERSALCLEPNAAVWQIYAYYLNRQAYASSTNASVGTLKWWFGISSCKFGRVEKSILHEKVKCRLLTRGIP